MRFDWRYLPLLVPALGSHRGGHAAADPVATAVSPSRVQPGQSVTVTGSNLQHDGYTAQLQYTKKYLTSGESPTAVVDATSQSATQLVFPAPADMRPTGLALRYRLTTRQQFLTAALVNDTSFASRAPFAIPGRVDVLEPPVIVSGGQGFAIGVNASGQPFSSILVLPGANQIQGKNFVAPPGAQTTVTFNGVPITQPAPPRYDPALSLGGGLGGDVISLQVVEPNASALAPLVVTTPAGTSTGPIALMLRRPRVTGVDEITSSGTVVAPAAGKLVRGKRYQVRGTDFAFPNVLNAHVTLGGVNMDNVVTVDATRAQFTVPATFAAAQAELQVNEVSTLAGSGGLFAVSDKGATPPPLADMVITPTPTPWGTVLTATIAFAGTITAGADVGSLVVTSTSPSDFAGMPVTVPITSNPQVVTVATRLRTTDAPRVVRVRLTRFTGVTDSLDRTVQLRQPSLTGFAFGTASVAGGSTATAQATLDIPNNASGSCSLNLFGQAEPVISLSVSDTSVVRLGASGVSTVCIAGNPTSIVLATQPVSETKTVQVTARLGTSTRTATLTVLPPSLTSLKVNRPSLTSLQSAVGTLTLSAPMPNGAALLSSSDPAVSVPAKWPLGSQTTTTFPVTTLPVSAPRAVTISAAVNGVTQSTTVMLNPLQLTSLSLSPQTVRAGSNTAGTISLNATIDLPFSATLTSGDPSVVTVPATVSFAAGQNAAVFNAQTVSPQTQSKTVTVTATYAVTLPDGSRVTTTQSGTVTVNP